MSIRSVTTFKAQGIGNRVVPDLHIEARVPIPSATQLQVESGSAVARMQDQAVKIVDAMQECLPGGVVDHIFAELARRKASQFVVPI